MTELTFDDAIKEIWYSTLNLIKESMESEGIDCGVTNNKIDWYNYLAEDNLEFFTNDGMPEFSDNGFTVDLSNYDPSNISSTGLSEAGVSFIAQEETGHPFGYKMIAKDLNGYDLGDAKGHKTYGYGLLFHPNGKYMDQIKSTWTQQELEQIYMAQVRQRFDKIKKWETSNNIELKQNQIDAIASAMYNFGDGFLNFSISKMIAKNPGDPSITSAWAHLSDKQGQKYPGLIKRRIKEAQIYSMG